MPVKVKYHGILKDIAGRGTENFEHVNTVALLKDKVYARYRQMREFVFVVAVNGIIDGDEAKITEEDCIEFIPPMPGG